MKFFRRTIYICEDFLCIDVMYPHICKNLKHQCPCCHTYHETFKGRCKICRKFCTNERHCKIPNKEVDRKTGTLKVVSLATFGAEDPNEHCWDCYWAGTPCNSCLQLIYDRNIDFEYVKYTTMTYKEFYEESKIWKPNWDDLSEDYELYRVGSHV